MTGIFVKRDGRVFQMEIPDEKRGESIDVPEVVDDASPPRRFKLDEVARYERVTYRPIEARDSNGRSVWLYLP